MFGHLKLGPMFLFSFQLFLIVICDIKSVSFCFLRFSGLNTQNLVFVRVENAAKSVFPPLPFSLASKNVCECVKFYNLGQNKWNIWTTPPPISMMPKWRVSCSFAPSSLLWGGWGIIVPFYTVQDCPRTTLALQEAMFAMQNTSDLLSHVR